MGVKLPKKVSCFHGLNFQESNSGPFEGEFFDAKKIGMPQKSTPQQRLVNWLIVGCLNHWNLRVPTPPTLYSKKSRTGPTKERTPGPVQTGVSNSSSNLLRGPLVRSLSILDGFIIGWIIKGLR